MTLLEFVPDNKIHTAKHGEYKTPNTKKKGIQPGNYLSYLFQYLKSFYQAISLASHPDLAITQSIDTHWSQALSAPTSRSNLPPFPLCPPHPRSPPSPLVMEGGWWWWRRGARSVAVMEMGRCWERRAREKAAGSLRPCAAMG